MMIASACKAERLQRKIAQPQRRVARTVNTPQGAISRFCRTE